jgi:FMN-dependent NADH-azoreductase
MNTTHPSAPRAPSVLLIQASPRGERSHSRRLADEFLQSWQTAHPQGQAAVRDLGYEPPPFVSEAWIEGAFTLPSGQSHAARAAIRVSDAYVNELLAADEIVIATPLYNLSIPAALKAWIDQVVRLGRTFAMGSAGFEGLLKTKRVRVLVASGSDFRPDGPYAAYNFVEPYLRAVLGFIGITDVTFVYAHSLNDGNPLRESSLAEARTSIQALAAA